MPYKNVNRALAQSKENQTATASRFLLAIDSSMSCLRKCFSANEIDETDFY